jgi:AcrR family transcriptional regulator
MSDTISTPSESDTGPVRSNRAERTRVLIIASAVDCLYKFGYSATSTIRVAQCAQVSRGAMLHHFPTKAFMMAEVVRSTYENDASFYRQALAGAVGVTEQLNILIDAAWVRFKSPDGIAQVEVWQASRSDSELASAVMPAHDEVTNQSHLGLHAIMSGAGFVSKAQTRSLLLFTVAALRGMAMERALRTPESLLLPGLARLKWILHEALAEISINPVTRSE